MDALWSILMFLGSAVCHQLPERSYFLGDLQMPLCARCIGIQLGFLLSSLFLWTGGRRFASALLGKRSMIVLAILFIIGFGDGILSYSGVSQSDNLRRTISGLLIGTTVPFVVVPLLNGILFPGRNGHRILEKMTDWGWYVVIFALGAAAIFASVSFAPLFYSVSVLGIAGVFAFFITMITLLVMVLLDRKSISIKNKLVLSAVIAIAVIMSLAVIHNVFFPQI